MHLGQGRHPPRRSPFTDVRFPFETPPLRRRRPSRRRRACLRAGGRDPRSAFRGGEGGVSLTRASPTGLNLRTPDRTASRLGLTPLETPASVDIVSGETAPARAGHDRRRRDQDATGITTIASPGNGNGAFTSRGFAGPNSIQQLYDGTRFYVGAGTVTFPFDTWNVERIEVLRGPSSVLYGDGAIGGIINVVPKKPTFVPINTARAVVGSDGIARPPSIRAAASRRPNTATPSPTV